MNTNIPSLKRILSILSVLIVSLLYNAQAQASIAIGAALPLTGALQAYGKTLISGIQLALDQANNTEKGIDGKGTKVELNVTDTQSQPQTAVTSIEKLVLAQKTLAIIGPMSSPEVIAGATSVLPQHDVVIITPTATSPTISTLNSRGFLFRTILSDAYQGTALAQLSLLKGFKRVSVLYVNNEYGAGLNKTFVESFKKQGGQIAGDIAYLPSKQTYRTELQSLISKGKSDALLIIGYPDDGGMIILKEAIENQFFTNFLASDGMFTPAIITNLGQEYLNGHIFGTAPSSSGLTDGAITFNRMYLMQYKTTPENVYIASAYDDTAIILLAIAKACHDNETSSPTAAQVRDQIYNITGNNKATIIYPDTIDKGIELIQAGKPVTYSGTLRQISFDANGDMKGNLNDFEIWTVTDGSMHFSNFVNTTTVE